MKLLKLINLSTEHNATDSGGGNGGGADNISDHGIGGQDKDRNYTVNSCVH